MRDPVSNEVDSVLRMIPTAVFQPHHRLTLVHFDTHTNTRTCANKKINNNSKVQTSKPRLNVDSPLPKVIGPAATKANEEKPRFLSPSLGSHRAPES